MDELELLCHRLAGGGPECARIAEQARSLGAERPRQLAFAVMACRELEAPAPADPAGDLRGAVAAELAAAGARLPSVQREALALRELLGLDHAAIGSVLELDPSRVPAILGEARIALRAQLRGSATPAGTCVEHERTVRTATVRQDGEPVSAGDTDWLFEHLGQCPECARAHAVMLEGSAAYRGWPA